MTKQTLFGLATALAFAGWFVSCGLNTPESASAARPEPSQSLDRSPVDLVLSADEQHLFVANQTSGTVSLVLGLIGMALPVMPTTPFLLLAAACYLNGSKRMYRWMTRNRLFGRYLGDYMEGRGITLRAKAVSISVLWIALSISMILASDDWIIQAVLLVVGASVTIHIMRIKTRR